jgi:hypothetical protein
LEGGYGHIRLTLSDEGLREVTPATESIAKWSSVTGVIHDADRIIVRLATGQAAVINGRSYSGPVPFQELPRLISEFRKQFGGRPV